MDDLGQLILRGATDSDPWFIAAHSTVDLSGELIERKIPEGFVPRRDDTVIAVISEPRVDRARDIVTDSWRLGRYRRNPVVLWGHDNRQPAVGMAVQTVLLGTEGKRQLVQEIAFDAADPRAAAIGAKYSAGILRAFSVGFISHRREFRTDLPKDDPAHTTAESRWRGGQKLSDNELLENSAVNVPMLQTALAVRRVAEPESDANAAWRDRFLWALRNDDELRALLREAIGPEPHVHGPAPAMTLHDLLAS